jgi:hypothetical protein
LTNGVQCTKSPLIPLLQSGKLGKGLRVALPYIVEKATIEIASPPDEIGRARNDTVGLVDSWGGKKRKISLLSLPVSSTGQAFTKEG